jgi:hypothetical protein
VLIREVTPLPEDVYLQSAYTVWIGHAVVLQLAAADLRAPVSGSIVGESENAIRFRIGQGWEIDIPKSMILAVEEDSCTSILRRLSQTAGLSFGKSNASERYPA